MSARVPSLVSPAWLAARLPSVKVVDASWYLPAMGRDGKAEYAARRIPGARHWDLDATDDPSDLPHMLPSPGFFADSMAALFEKLLGAEQKGETDPDVAELLKKMGAAAKGREG